MMEHSDIFELFQAKKPDGSFNMGPAYNAFAKIIFDYKEACEEIDRLKTFNNKLKTKLNKEEEQLILPVAKPILAPTIPRVTKKKRDDLKKESSKTIAPSAVEQPEKIVIQSNKKSPYVHYDLACDNFIRMNNGKILIKVGYKNDDYTMFVKVISMESDKKSELLVKCATLELEFRIKFKNGSSSFSISPDGEVNFTDCLIYPLTQNLLDEAYKPLSEHNPDSKIKSNMMNFGKSLHLVALALLDKDVHFANKKSLDCEIIGNFPNDVVVPLPGDADVTASPDQ